MKDRPFMFSDAPMFSHVMHDKSICRQVLERILRFKIDSIDYSETERAIDDATGAKGVCLDVLVKSEGKLFDVEIQVANERDLNRRMRYYQGRLDAMSLSKGSQYGSLPDSYIIFICKYDEYERGLPCYSFEMTCREASGLKSTCGMRWIVLNTKAWQDEASSMLSDLLHYIDIGSISDNALLKDPLIDSIDKQVEKANSDREWRKRAMGIMTLEQDFENRLYYAEKRGLEQGREQGREQFARLVKMLMSEGKTEKLDRALNSPDYCEELYKEYDL